MRVRLFDIDWDADDHETDLPTELTIEVDEDFDADNDSADWLSDNYGWCVNSVNVEVL